MSVNPIFQKTLDSISTTFTPVAAPKLPTALRPDDTCTYEGEGYKAELSYVVHDYGTKDDSADVELLWIEMDFGGSKVWTGDPAYISNDLEQVFTEHCREHCDRQEALRLADLKAGVR